MEWNGLVLDTNGRGRKTIAVVIEWTWCLKSVYEEIKRNKKKKRN